MFRKWTVMEQKFYWEKILHIICFCTRIFAAAYLLKINKKFFFEKIKHFWFMMNSPDVYTKYRTGKVFHDTAILLVYTVKV